MDTRPIGVLDSGVGGLTVWKEIVTLLPHESTIYIGDSKNAPYGNKSSDEIFRLATQLFDFLQKRNVKLIVVACNTITVNGIEKLRAAYANIPIVGAVPVVKRAVAVTKKKRIGVFSTTSTAKSDYQKKLISLFANNVTVINKGTDELVPLIEKAIINGEKIDSILAEQLKPFQEAQIDVLALGCTHFPFVKKSIQKILGKRILLFDSGPAIARQVKRILENNNAVGKTKTSVHQLYTTGDKDMFEKIIVKLNPGKWEMIIDSVQ